jgi:predicted GNAT family acetyltransferase
MTDTAPAYTVSHNAAAQRFETTVDGHLALAEYRMTQPTVMRLTHTEVPQALEGRGIAGALARFAMAHAREHRLKIDPQCPYMRAYMEKHPETHDLRV